MPEMTRIQVVEKMFGELANKAHQSDGYLVTLHTYKDGAPHHEAHTLNFPTGAFPIVLNELRRQMDEFAQQARGKGKVE